MDRANHSNHCAAAIRAAASVFLLGAALPLAAQTATRDPLVQPFAVDSIWNMPIGTGAQYVPINIAAVVNNFVWTPMPQIDDEYIFLDSTAPLTNLNYSDAAWTGRDRCPATGGLLLQAPFPTNYVVPNSLGNNAAVFLMPDNRTLIHTQPITRCVAGGPATALLTFNAVDIYGDGRYGSHGGSSLSAIGGSIRLGEFRPGIPVRHAIKIDVDTPVVLARCSTASDCFRWPAFNADAGAAGSYGTQNTNPVPGMKMGALLAIPTSTNINTLGLESVPGQMLAWTLQNYGAYIVDSTGGPGFVISAETGPKGSVRDQFRADFGMNLEQRVNDNTPWSRDMQRLVQALYLVNNNGPTSIGGGGTPLQPLALPLQLPGGADTIPPTVPGALAASVASLQINLSWTASTDNVGVSGYKVFRNGVQIATTSSLTYADAGLLPLTLYNYAVAAFDAAGNTSAQSTVSASTLAASDTQAPTVPTGLVGTAVSSSQINLSWNPSTDNVGVTGYYVYLNDVALTTTATTSFQHTGLTAGTTYNYRVSSYDAAANNSAWTATPVSVTTPPAADTIAPSVPSGLTATAVSPAQINLSWAASTDNVGVSGYRVYRAGTLLATLGAVTSYQSTGLAPSTTYSYTVQAVDAAGNASAQSASASATTQAASDTIAPSVPTGLAAAAVSSTQINLSWAASTDNVGVSGYRVYRAGTLLATLGAVTSYQSTGLAPSTTYSYTVQAVDAAGNASAQSTSASATTQAASDTIAPSVPTGLRAKVVSQTRASLTWAASTDNVGVTGYRVYLNDVALATTTTRSFTHSGLTAGTTYNYRVSAFDAAGNESAWTDPVSVKTLVSRLVGSDFNSDRKSDILWRNTATGENTIWLMNGATVSAGVSTNALADLNYGIAGVGDFNGDGKSDILWHNRATGENAVWLMNGTALSGGAVFATITDPNWSIAGIGDFNADGKSDILWRNNATGQNMIYLMNGVRVSSATAVATVADLSWSIAGVGDFDGDGKSDILWRNGATGENAIWFMNGTTLSVNSPVGGLDVNWRVAGVGDFDGDGKSDILWHNGTTGENAVWLMNGATLSSGGAFATITDANWSVAGVGDFDGDGKSDILWRNNATGENVIYLMNGTTISSSASVNVVPGNAWSVTLR
jgi:chitodextrinase